MWHLMVLVFLIIVGALNPSKNSSSSSSGDYDDTCCCLYYEAAKTGMPSDKVRYDRLDFVECMRLGGKCQSDNTKCY